MYNVNIVSSIKDSDRCGLGSKSNDFEPIFIEYSAPTNYRPQTNVKQGIVLRRLQTSFSVIMISIRVWNIFLWETNERNSVLKFYLTIF